ncbi:helix-turn-helix domain-containing protein [uncultured Alistipes sp.]|uniref:helix-turn-helix domain-containing protein n=1 Tax=uncultured Alistipes sp. TaxID=538949 RepID=UPI003208D861
MNNEIRETPITRFTLQELISIHGGTNRPGIMGECIAASTKSHLQTFRDPCRIDAFIIGVGTEGECSGLLNLQEFRIKKDTLFICGPNSILQGQSVEQLTVHTIAISPDFFKRINIDTKHLLPLLLQFASYPCLDISHDECQAMQSFIALIEQELKAPESEFSTEIIGGLISGTIYKVGEILHRYLSEHPEVENPAHDRAKEHFTQFIRLLNESYKRERSVGFYAQQLCITPKYLTTLIKRISGKSVSEWIDSYVILEAKTLLKYSDMSVQEIAYSLNFPNQSFFGSYFKRNTGMSPSQYRTRQQHG